MKIPSYERSFASYDGLVPGTDIKKVDCWDNDKNTDAKKNKITPRNVFKASRNKYWFECRICKHSFESSLSNISSKNLKWCAYCANKKLCEDKNCSYCYNNSFASFEDLVPGTGVKKVDCWDNERNKDVTPKDVFKKTHKKYWFNCPVCKHSFESVLYSITSKNPVWCPSCSHSGYSRLQIIILNFLASLWNMDIQHAENGGEHKINGMKVDGYCEEKKTVIEVHGSFWHGEPKIYPQDEIQPVKKKTYGELYRKTKEKDEKIEKSGYNLKIIWDESEWNVAQRSIIKIQRIFREKIQKI